MDNYEFCVRWALERRGRVLDYGCGAGGVVRKMRERGIEGFGCDVFYAGNVERSSGLIAADIRPWVRRMENGLIPFADASFDAIVTNQVLEHVPDLDLSLREIARVLKPGGAVLALFPDKTVWREGHCGIPFLHWFPKGSNARVYYAAALRALGAGHNKADFPGVMNWARSFCDWLDKWTYYRSPTDIRNVFARHFTRTEHIEHDWFVARVPQSRILPPTLRRIAAQKMAGLVLVSER
jgi:SAM-dependent methyltransferase